MSYIRYIYKLIRYWMKFSADDEDTMSQEHGGHLVSDENPLNESENSNLQIILLTILTILCIYLWTTRRNPRPIAGIYQQPGNGYYMKFLFIYSSITIRKILRKLKEMKKYKMKYDMELDKCKELETLKPLPPDSHKAVDAVYFIAASKDGFYLTASMARRPNKVMDCIWLLRIPNVGLLKGIHHPDTTLVADKPMKYSGGGLVLEMIEPMKRWTITFKGQMRLNNEEGTLLEVSLTADYVSCVPCFNCDDDIPTISLASAIAREPWDRKYFHTLKKAHQNHYEQVGIIRGEVEVEGYGPFDFHLSALRDHTIAQYREWKYMHRYGFHFITLENGLRIMVGIISQPVTFSCFEFGFVCETAGKIHGVEWCDLPLHYHGEGGQPPLDYAFCFQAGGKKYWVQCTVIETPEVFIGKEWEARILERMCTFTVNGVPGWGFAEWEYRHHGGRAEQYHQVLSKFRLAS